MWFPAVKIFRDSFNTFSGCWNFCLIAQLRSEGIDNLGKVKRMYFEPSGGFVILEAPKPRPGLPIVPVWDEEYMEDRQTIHDKFACCNCGQIVNEQKKPNRACTQCGHNKWREAVK